MCSLFYADDVVFAECPSELQRLLDVLYDWCNPWKLPVNYKKSNVTHFRKRRQMRIQMKFILGKKRVDYAELYKCLGVYINEFLNYDYTAEQMAHSGERGLGSVIQKYKTYPDMSYSTYTNFF